MKKVLCPTCGLMNLDRFITFPHCAGCGTRLPEIAPPRMIDFWRRPLGAPMWATIIGLCCVGIGVVGASISRDTSAVPERQLVVYAQVQRQMQLGEHAALLLALDTTEADENANVRSFEDVRVRLARSTLQSFELGAISPKPDAQRESGSGKYLIFHQLGRDQSIRLGIRARRSGEQKITLSLYVRDFSPFEVRNMVNVTRPSRATVPNLAQPKSP